MQRYSDEETLDYIKLYTENPYPRTVELLAKKWDRTIRQVAAKLTREGIYKKPKYTTKTGEIPTSKDEYVELIANSLALASADLEGLEKAPKQTLRNLLKAIDPEVIESLKVVNV